MPAVVWRRVRMSGLVLVVFRCLRRSSRVQMTARAVRWRTRGLSTWNG